MKILAISGSNAVNSMNSVLVKFAAQQFTGDNEVEFYDMTNFEMPIYRHEIEVEKGVPKEAEKFAAKVDAADVILLSLPEHNGTYSTAFKNVFDWVSRIKDRTVFSEKPMLLMSTSPGGRGGAGVLEAATKRFPFHGGNIVETFSVPFYNDHLEKDKGLLNDDKVKELKEKITKVEALENLIKK